MCLPADTHGSLIRHHMVCGLISESNVNAFMGAMVAVKEEATATGIPEGAWRKAVAAVGSAQPLKGKISCSGKGDVSASPAVTPGTLAAAFTGVASNFATQFAGVLSDVSEECSEPVRVALKS